MIMIILYDNESEEQKVEKRNNLSKAAHEIEEEFNREFGAEELMQITHHHLGTKDNPKLTNQAIVDAITDCLTKLGVV